jgi:hypothetical protein
MHLFLAQRTVWLRTILVAFCVYLLQNSFLNIFCEKSLFFRDGQTQHEYVFDTKSH